MKRDLNEKTEEWLKMALLYNEWMCHSQIHTVKLNAQHDDIWSQGLQDCKGGALVNGVSVLTKNI